MTTLALRTEFRRNPTLPILIGDDVFIRGVRKGVEGGQYVYRSGDADFTAPEILPRTSESMNGPWSSPWYYAKNK